MIIVDTSVLKNNFIVNYTKQSNNVVLLNKFLNKDFLNINYSKSCIFGLKYLIVTKLPINYNSNKLEEKYYSYVNFMKIFNIIKSHSYINQKNTEISIKVLIKKVQELYKNSINNSTYPLLDIYKIRL